MYVFMNIVKDQVSGVVLVAQGNNCFVGVVLLTSEETSLLVKVPVKGF